MPRQNSQALADAIHRALSQDWDPENLCELISKYTWENTSKQISIEIEKSFHQ
ncbi:MAG: hypothetical protein AAB035_01110 [Nitrospirota bacterium]